MSRYGWTIRSASRKLDYIVLQFRILATTCFLIICQTHHASAQVTNITWTGIDLSIPIDDRSQIDIKPIIRHNLDGEGYQNTSLDIFYRRSFDQGFFGQVLTRTWFMPEARYRLFLWLDVGKKWKIKKSTLRQKFRLHYAVDVNDNFDGDFIRSFTTISHPVSERLSISLNLEPWLSLNDDIQISRYRIEPGVAYNLSETWRIKAVYRWQSDFREVPINNQNHLVTTLIYKLVREERKSAP
jgi:hypothetical protein